MSLQKIALFAAISVSVAALGATATWLAADDKATPAATKQAKDKASDDGCPGSGPGTPRTTLKIQYREYFQDSEAQPTIVDLVVRDDYRWRRVQNTVTAKGMTMDERSRRMDEILALSEELGIFTGDAPVTQEKLTIYREAKMKLEADIAASENQLNDIVHDRIYVKAPAPAWSFQYDNESRIGQRNRRTDGREIVAAALERGDAHRQFAELLAGADLDQAKTAGTRSVAGHTCEVVQMNEPFKAEICQKQFGEQEIVLYSRWSRDTGAMIKEALAVEEGVCIPLSQFAPPVDIDWGEDS